MTASGGKVLIYQGGAGDGEEIDNNVFDGEETAEKNLTGEGEAEVVDRPDRDQAGEFDCEGCECGDGGEGFRIEAGEQGCDEPVERYCPEEGAEVFVEEPGEVEWGVADGQADGDGDEEDEQRGEGAAHAGWFPNV